MGFPVDPEPPAAGAPCARCWGVGKPFGDVDTPAVIWVLIEEVYEGAAWIPGMPPAPYGWVELTQIAPCHWRGNIDLDWTVSLTFHNGWTHLDVVQAIWHPFVDMPAVECEWLFENDNLDPAGLWYGGFATVISWSITPVIGPTYNFITGEDTRLATFNGDADAMTFRLANKKYNTNVLIRYDRS